MANPILEINELKESQLIHGNVQILGTLTVGTVQYAKDNLDATTDPTVNDDITEGYTRGSIWINSSSNEAFRLVDSTEGAAVWVLSTLDSEDLGTLAFMNANAVAITGGTIDGVSMASGTASGVLYLNGSKVATSGSALTFDGTTFGVTSSGNNVANFLGSSSAYVDISDGTGILRFQMLSNTPNIGSSTNHDVILKRNGTETVRLISSGVSVTGNLIFTQLNNGIFQDTSDSSDTRYTAIGGGGAENVTRGAFIQLHGNEHATRAGLARYYAGQGGNTDGTKGIHIFKSFDNSDVLFIGNKTTAGMDWLGLGASPTAALDIVGSGKYFRVSSVSQGNGLEGGWSESGNTAFLQGYDRDNSVFRNLLLNNSLKIDASGNVGIGGTPTVKFQVFGNASKITGVDDTTHLYHQLTTSSATGGGMIGIEGSVAGQLVSGTTAYATVIGSTSSGTHTQLFSAGVVRATLHYNGKFGIGTASPDGTLHVHTASAGTITASTSADDLVVENSTSAGISILTPDASTGKLVLGSPTQNQGVSLTWAYSSGVSNLATNKAGATLNFLSDASVQNLTLSGSSGNQIAEFSGNVRLASGKSLYFDGGGDTRIVEASANVLTIFAGGQATFDTSATHTRVNVGNLGVGVTPTGGWNSVYRAIQLGSAGGISGRTDTEETVIYSNAFRHSSGDYKYIVDGNATRYEQTAGVHYWFNSVSGTAGNTITFSEAARIDSDGLKFNGDTAAANALNDWETGSWTPVLDYNTTGTLSLGYTTQTGTYIKKGSEVTVRAVIRLGSFNKGTASGSLVITGLPFTPSGIDHFIGVLSTYNSPVTGTPQCQVTAGNTWIELIQLVADAPWASLDDPDANSQYMLTLSYTV